jgi:hypothetical protein
MLCAVNPQTGSSQSLLIATVQKAKNDNRPKKGHFLCIFALLYFSTAKRSEAQVSSIGRARLRPYIRKSTKAQWLFFSQEVR